MALVYGVVKLTQFPSFSMHGQASALVVNFVVNLSHVAQHFFHLRTTNQAEWTNLHSPLLPVSSIDAQGPRIHYNAKPILQASCGQKCVKTTVLGLASTICLALSPLCCVFGIVKGVAGCCCQARNARALKKKRAKAFAALQIDHPSHLFPNDNAIGGGAPILKGVRVLELATVVAGPSAGRILAEHGAEVIRVEPPSGDMWRNYLKILEGHRPTFTSTFEHTSFNKSSVVLDLTTPNGVAEMKTLMGKADMFITNVRLPALVKLGLDYNSVKNHAPHLVYGHLSAWGLIGPAKGAPGYDFGAFWSQTGMAALNNSQGHFAQYPGAFGGKWGVWLLWLLLLFTLVHYFGALLWCITLVHHFGASVFVTHVLFHRACPIHSVHPSFPHHLRYGDTIAGSNLVSGMVSGLRQRFTNGGVGCYLETSLLRRYGRRVLLLLVVACSVGVVV